MEHPSTTRLEAFSDGVIAIIVTLLVLEIKVPHLEAPSWAGFVAALAPLAPKLIGFAFSFFTVAIFWVNHHGFFHRLKHSTWRLLWHNNLLLFCLSIIPFTTAFVRFPREPVCSGRVRAQLILSRSGLRAHVALRAGAFQSSR
jgi:uncharacterized membrane protein